MNRGREPGRSPLMQFRRHGRRMTIIDRYVLAQVGKPLLVSFVIGLLMLLAERFVRILDLTLGKKGSLTLVFEMLGYLVPHYLGLAIPASIFLGLLYGFNQMSRHAEIDAFLAAGVSLHRLARPVIMLSVLASLLAVFIFGWMQPYTRYAYRALKYTVQNVEVFLLAEEGVFMQAGRRTFIIDELDRQNQRFRRLFLFTDLGERGSETVTAERGRLVRQRHDPRPLLILERGHRLKIDGRPHPERAAEPLPKFESGLFARAEAPLGREGALVFRPRGVDERELMLPELWATLDRPRAQATVNELHAEFHKRLVAILTLPVLPFLAIPFAIGQRRRQRAYRFAVALAILIAYNEAVQQGATAVRLGQLPAWLGIWGPWFMLLTFSLVRYYRTCFTLRRDMFESLYELLGSIARRSKALFRRSGKEEAA